MTGTPHRILHRTADQVLPEIVVYPPAYVGYLVEVSLPWTPRPRPPVRWPGPGTGLHPVAALSPLTLRLLEPYRPGRGRSQLAGSVLHHQATGAVVQPGWPPASPDHRRSLRVVTPVTRNTLDEYPTHWERKRACGLASLPASYSPSSETTAPSTAWAARSGSFIARSMRARTTAATGTRST